MSLDDNRRPPDVHSLGTAVVGGRCPDAAVAKSLVTADARFGGRARAYS
jgi:hypothetical protein